MSTNAQPPGLGISRKVFLLRKRRKARSDAYARIAVRGMEGLARFIAGHNWVYTMLRNKNQKKTESISITLQTEVFWAKGRISHIFSFLREGRKGDNRKQTQHRNRNGTKTFFLHFFYFAAPYAV